MADTTNATGAASGTTLQGDMTRNYAMKRMLKQQQTAEPTVRPGRVAPPQAVQPVKRY